MTMHAGTTGLTHPLAWPWAVASPSFVSSEAGSWQGALIRSWRDTSADMAQPPLDHHYVVMHLGGAKRVRRRRDGPPISTVVECASLTFVPAGTAYLWHTEGPIRFAHLYVPPRRLKQVMEQDFDVEGRDASLAEKVGCRDRFLEPLLAKMVQLLAARTPAPTLLLDGLLAHFHERLAQSHASAAPRKNAEPVAMAGHRLRRVLDYIDANLARDIGLADLVAAAGSSQSHFSRAFRKATGVSPYGYLLSQRIDYAKVLLLSGDEALDAVSATCGFRHREQFTTMFKRKVGVGPKRFRMLHRTQPRRDPAGTPS